MATAESLAEYVVSTAGVHPRDRFEHWYESSRQVWGPYESTPRGDVGFEGELRNLQFAGMSLSVMQITGMSAWRTERQAAKLKEGVYIIVQLDGEFLVSQDGREARLEPNDITIVDVQKAAGFLHPRESRTIILEVSRRDCEARLGPIGQWAARRIDGTSGAGALASSFIRLIPDQAAHLSETGQSQITMQLLDLVALAFKESEGEALVHSSARLGSLLRLKGVIEANLTRSGVTCEEIATAAGLSVRYANQLLDAERTSLQRLLFSRRIAKCQAALADPMQAHRQISDIAYSWGFSDVSHFGRLFKAIAGLTPREYRRHALVPAASR